MSQQFLPLLKPENIEELKTLILQIMEDNDTKLEKIIQNRQNQALQNAQEFTLDDLNDILQDECIQKQKIVSNLSHFALSLMNTIEVLWQDNEDLQYKIKDQREMIEEMNHHLHELSREGDFLKNKLHFTYNDLHKVEQQKLAIQEYLNSIITKNDLSTLLKQQRKTVQNTPSIKDSPLIILQGLQVTQNAGNKFQSPRDHPDTQKEDRSHLQDSISIIQREGEKQNHETELHLLEQSLIKDSISVLRRFTLEDEMQVKLPLLEENTQTVTFIPKSNRFSLINEISLQIFQEPKVMDTSSIIQPETNEKASAKQKSIIRDLRISNQKVNITIATGTQFTKAKDDDKNIHEQFSLINPSPSSTSILLNRQNSAIMYPSLMRSTSSISFVSHTTKQIQTDPLKPKTSKDLRKVQKKSIGIDASTSIGKKKSPTKLKQKIEQVKAKVKQASHPSNKSCEEPMKEESKTLDQGEGRKSFSQLLSYFTKKIVSDRIKTSNKKQDLGGFKKTKSYIQKVF